MLYSQRNNGLIYNDIFIATIVGQSTFFFPKCDSPNCSYGLIILMTNEPHTIETYSQLANGS